MDGASGAGFGSESREPKVCTPPLNGSIEAVLEGVEPGDQCSGRQSVCFFILHFLLIVRFLLDACPLTGHPLDMLRSCH